MQEIIIKDSQKKIITEGGKFALYGCPLLLATLGISLENTVHPSRKLLPFLFIVSVVFYVGIIIKTLIKLHQSSKKSILKLNSNGITILNKEYFEWSEIFDFKIVYKNRRTFNNRSRVHETTKLKFLQINDTKFDFTDQYSNFELEDLIEIIKRYKEN